MDWRIILVVLCLIGVAQAQSSGNGTQSSSSTNGTQSSSSTNGTQSSSSTNGTQSSSSTNGTQSSSSTNGTQSSSSTNGTQSSSTNGTQSSSSTNGTQSSSSTNGTQSSSSTNGTQSSSSTNGTQSASITTTAAPVAVAFNVSFSINQIFDSNLSNTSSPQFISLANSLTTQITAVLKNLPNFLFFKIWRFRSGSIVVDCSVGFSNSSGNPPNASTVISTFNNAISIGSLNFSVILSSLNIVQNIGVGQAQSSGNGTQSSSSTNGTQSSSSTNGTQSSSNTTTSTTVTSSTTVILTTTAPVAAAFNLSFSINKDFDSNLSNTSSPQFISLANNLTTQITPFFKNLPNFLFFKIWRFRSGSIVTDSTLAFSNSSGSPPNTSTVLSTFTNAITSGSLNGSVILSSVNIVQTTGNAPGLVSSLSLLWMSLVFILLSAVLHL